MARSQMTAARAASDTDGDRQVAARPCLGDHGCCHIDGGPPDVFRVVFDPAICREMLWELGRRFARIVPVSSNRMARELVVPWLWR